MMRVPRSEVFDDIYFSAKDGLAETRHVFLDGNNLPEVWAGRDSFTICETGFGTGLNLLGVSKLWLDCDDPPKRLRYISFEKYPVDVEFIEDYLSQWDELSEVLTALLPVYAEGEFSLMDGVDVKLIFGDVNEKLPELDELVDCWLLDGFKPSMNPDMWSDVVLDHVARLSCAGTSFATFTAAGAVRRGLQERGFDVRKVQGFDRKREMLVGIYEG